MNSEKSPASNASQIALAFARREDVLCFWIFGAAHSTYELACLETTLKLVLEDLRGVRLVVLDCSHLTGVSRAAAQALGRIAHLAQGVPLVGVRPRESGVLLEESLNIPWFDLLETAVRYRPTRPSAQFGRSSRRLFFNRPFTDNPGERGRIRGVHGTLRRL
ncbi:MAG: hypothetical protein KatS3mg115_2312 [Candidatus Poribacteria bacterium]|nr:MAG: hypothetical protein KatS3mg115_2312 [Candidatus Poribacteria bacterium]